MKVVLNTTMALPTIPTILTLLVAFAVYYIARATRKPAGIPRIGKPGIIGYISTAFRYTLHGLECMKEGHEQFSGRPFALPTLAGTLIVLGPEHVDTLRTSDDTIVSVR